MRVALENPVVFVKGYGANEIVIVTVLFGKSVKTEIPVLVGREVVELDVMGCGGESVEMVALLYGTKLLGLVGLSEFAECNASVVILLCGVGSVATCLVVKQEQADETFDGESWHWKTNVGSPVVAVLIELMYVPQNSTAAADERIN